MGADNTYGETNFNPINMELTPQNITVIEPKATYEVPVFSVTDDGLVQSGTTVIRMCKGNRADPNAFRQEGFFTETLLAVALTYLQENNTGELANRDTSIAITHIEDALLRIGKRAAERKARGVQGTYQK